MKKSINRSRAKKRELAHGEAVRSGIRVNFVIIRDIDGVCCATKLTFQLLAAGAARTHR